MLFSDVWSENAALFERLMEFHSNPPILYYGINWDFFHILYSFSTSLMTSNIILYSACCSKKQICLPRQEPASQHDARRVAGRVQQARHAGKGADAPCRGHINRGVPGTYWSQGCLLQTGIHKGRCLFISRALWCSGSCSWLVIRGSWVQIPLGVYACR